MRLLFFSILLIFSQVEKEYIKEINNLIKRQSFKKAEKLVRELRKEKREEILEYYFIYLLYKNKKIDSVIIYSNNFLKNYSQTKFKVQVNYMLARSYEEKRFIIRAFETYIEVLKVENSPYYKEAERKILTYAKEISLLDLLRNLTKLQKFPIYYDILSIAFDKAREEGDIKAQEEIYAILKEYFPESPKTLEAKRLFERKSRFFRFFGEREKIALFLPVTGPDSFLGTEFLRGFKLSFGEREFKIFDTKGDPYVSYRLIKNFLSSYYDFPIAVGPILTDDIFVSIPLFAEKRSKVFILPSLSYIRTSEFSENVISYSRSINEEIRAIFERFIFPNDFDSISILIPETPEGESIYSLISELIPSYNNLKILFLTFSPDSIDFQSRLDSMAKFFGDTLGPDLIIFPTGSEEALLALSSQVVFKGFKSLIVTTGKFTTEEFAIKSNRYVEDRVIFSSIGIWDRSLYDKFVVEYKEKYGDYPGEISFIGYDTGLILRYAFENGMNGAVSFKNFLKDLKIFKGSYKLYLFAENGKDIVKFYRIKNNRFYEIR